MIKKFLFLISAYFILFTILSTKVKAAGEFDIETTATYNISSEGIANVNHKIKLINKQPNVYATHYALSIASTRVQNIWAKDQVSDLEPNIQTTSNDTTISVEFVQKAVGIDKVLEFSIGYQDLDIVQKIGRVYEINIPRPKNISEFQNYSIILSVPNELESPVQIIPTPDEVTKVASTTYYVFKKENLFSRGVTALFGEQQVFSFDLRFTLYNPNPVTKISEIAIPPDTQYQRVFYEAIIPNPQNIYLDADGNWLAQYKLSAREKLEVHAIGSVILSLDPLKKPDPPSDYNKYLQAQLPWQVDDQQIKKLAQSLKTPEKIYNFVVDNLEYNYDRIDQGSARLGAKAALTNPDQAICMEFTDLFIALARSAGIPARELNGFAYTQNPNLRPLSLRQDVLHAWPEYYDFEKKQWIQVDPTWGNTTQGIDYFSRFDLNHVVFVIHGESSQTPFPAGFYKLEDSQGKDIVINPEQKSPEIYEFHEISLENKNSITAGIESNSNLIILNSGNSASYNVSVQLSSDDFDILSSKQHNIDSLLPYASFKIPIKTIAAHPFKTRTGRLNITIGENSYEKTIIIEPLYAKFPQAIVALAMGTAFAAVATRSGSLLFSIFKRRNSLYR